MVTGPGKNNSVKQSEGTHQWLIPLLIILVVGICTAISWELISNLAVSKSASASELTRINNYIGHIKDSTTGMDSFASKQNSRIETLTDDTQAKFDETDKKITDTNTKLTDTGNKLNDTASKLNDTNNKLTDTNNKVDKTQNDLAGVKTQTDTLISQTSQLGSKLSDVSQKVADVKTQADTINSNVDTINTNISTLSTSINNLVGGLQITPTVSSSSTSAGTGYITLSINSSIDQTIALKVEFREPSGTSTTLATDTTMDGILKTLYATPPLYLYESSSSGTRIRGDYSIFYNSSDSKYHVGKITFLTQATSLSAGNNTKYLYFTYTAAAVSYDIIITPETDATYTTTGSSAVTW